MSLSLNADVDWTTWRADDVATLMFVVRATEVLLIRKLRGLGAGKINGPGGRLEPGETLVEAAVRETEEEVGVVPRDPRSRGVLRFAFTNGYNLECHVFSADGCDGEPRESDEAIPLWVPLGKIPYDEMWADDRLWLPHMLSGRTPLSGRFVFDDDRMLDHDIESFDPATALFERLTALDIRCETHPHPPVFTVGEAKAVRPPGAGLHTKNLFLRNKKKRMWLVTLEEDRPVDLRALGRQLGAGNLSFASPARLRRHLGVEPGSVTPLALINDADAEVTMVLERELADSAALWCHPLTNDRTTRLSGPDLVRFLQASGHPPILI